MLALALGALGVGCSIGEGTGFATGEVVAADCDVDDADYALQPTFFGGEIIDEQLNVRMQRGSAAESLSDGIAIFVRDSNEVFLDRIGIPIAIEDDWRALVQMQFYFNESCATGFPNRRLRRRPLILQAVEGTITFRAIYAPDIEPGQTLTEASFDDVEFRDRDDPERRATLSGALEFFYQRGSPAQPFP